MKAALFSIVPYERPVAQTGWPVAAADYDAETAQASMRRALDFFELHRISAGLAVTTVPRAKESLRVYREATGRHGCEPESDQVLYRAAVHVAESDEEAWADCAPFATPDRAVGALSMANPAIDEAVAGAGYYGRETAAQRARVAAAGDLQERLDTGQLLAGAPGTVLRQVESVARELGAGILEQAFIAPSPDKRRRSIELFGEQVLPRMREL